MDIVEIGRLLDGLRPLGEGGGIMAVFGGIILAVRKNRFEEDKQIVAYRTRSLEDLHADVEKERAGRAEIEARLRQEEKRSDRMLSAARAWYGFCCDERHDRKNDRQEHICYEINAGIVPLRLPAPAPLPPLAEENE